MNDGSIPLLAADNVEKDYQSGPEVVHVLRGASMYVNAGEVVALVGASGVGKSTLLHLFGALDRPTRGRVLIAGVDLFEQSESALVNGPRVIIADEPTGNLDPKTSEVIYDLFLRLQAERGIAFLIATHNPDLARKAERGYRLVEGRARGLGAE